MSPALQLPPDITQQQLQLAQEKGEHVEFRRNQVQSRAEGMEVMNELICERHGVIQHGHEKIMCIDAVVDEAHGTMKEGNAELAKAEEHQKKIWHIT
jgi:hypothetical protein